MTHTTHPTENTEARQSGIALLAGSIGGILTMAIHPTGVGTLNPQQLDHLALTAAIAHSLALFSFLIMFLGACGLTRRLASHPSAAPPDHLAFAALVTYAFAAVALLIAATVSGFISPTLMRHMAHDIPSAAPQWRITLDAVFQINQAFARIYSVAASLSIAVWSASALRNGGLGRRIAIYGCISSALLIVLMAVGHLKLNVHGMAAVVVCQAIWFIIVAIQLTQQTPDPSIPE